MSDKIKDGGPAFPTENAMQTGPSSYRYEGMTMRDYFASKAMPEIMREWDLERREPGGEGCFDAHVTLMAEESYRMADAMLKAREAE